MREIHLKANLLHKIQHWKNIIRLTICKTIKIMTNFIAFKLRKKLLVVVAEIIMLIHFMYIGQHNFIV